MITFIIEHNDSPYTFEIEDKETILELKEKIMKHYNVKSKYIDIDFQLERPIRSLGKFNLESGILPRSLDAYKFNRYGLDGKEVTATFHEVNDYGPKKYDKKFKHVNIMKRKAEDRTLNDGEPSFDITSENDFPSLG